jgi:hypothetical protein
MNVQKKLLVLVLAGIILNLESSEKKQLLECYRFILPTGLVYFPRNEWLVLKIIINQCSNCLLHIIVIGQAQAKRDVTGLLW